MNLENIHEREGKEEPQKEAFNGDFELQLTDAIDSTDASLRDHLENIKVMQDERDNDIEKRIKKLETF